MNNINYSDLFDRLFPICRSITGEGYRKSLKILSKYINFKVLKFPTGSKVFDWIVPPEWNIYDAYILKDKKKVVDFKNNNLHIVSYSHSINKTIDLNELDKHLFSIKKYPNFIPYVTSYYKKYWGFCIQHNKRKKLKKGKYQVVIKSKLSKGNVEIGLEKLKGKTDKIMLLSSYLCHPSMANNELSGPLVMVGLYNKIKQWKNRNLNYYFLINPETIGSICFLSKYAKKLKKDLHSGMVVTSMGGPNNKLIYKKSRSDTSSLDRLFRYYDDKKKYLVRDFDPAEGSDEKQYCGAELNLPVGQISRTRHGEYYQYHSSGDDKKFMNIKKIEQSIESMEKILKVNDLIFPLKRYLPYCEPQLGKRNLYPQINSARKKIKSKLTDSRKQLDILLNLLSYADKKHDIIDVAHKSGFEIEEIADALKKAIKHKLIKI